MDIAVGAIQHQRALAQRAALDEPQAGPLASVAGGGFVIVLVIVAAIPGAEIADGQEAEVVVVRHAVDEGLRSARTEAGILFARPDIGAQETAAAWARQHDRLRPVGGAFADLAVATLELRDQEVAEKAAIVREPAQRERAARHARFVRRVETALAKRI